MYTFDPDKIKQDVESISDQPADVTTNWPNLDVASKPQAERPADVWYIDDTRNNNTLGKFSSIREAKRIHKKLPPHIQINTEIRLNDATWSDLEDERQSTREAQRINYEPFKDYIEQVMPLARRDDSSWPSTIHTNGKTYKQHPDNAKIMAKHIRDRKKLFKGVI